jgi:nitrate reductase beta subunit
MKGTQKLSKYQYLVGIDLTNEDTSEFSMNRVDLSNKSKKSLKYSDRLSATKAAHLQKNGSIDKQQREILPNLKAKYTNGYMLGHIKYDYSNILAEKNNKTEPLSRPINKLSPAKNRTGNLVGKLK